MRTTSVCVALLVLTASPLRGATPVNEICYSAAFPFNATPSPSNTMPFTCPNAGVGTVPQLAAQGLRIVRLTGISGPDSMMQYQLVVKSTNEVFTNGFE